MAYKEPYTVVTNWPETNNYNIGDSLCFHYTLTLEQVKEQFKGSIGNMLRTHMIENNFKRVIISQTILLRNLGGTLVWTPVGTPRVPDESYFLKV